MKKLSDKKVAEAANMSLTAFRARNASFQQQLRDDVQKALDSKQEGK